MSTTMLYSYPRTISSIYSSKGYCKVGKVMFDYIIVKDNEIDSCLKEGFFKTAQGALDDYNAKNNTPKDSLYDTFKDDVIIHNLTEDNIKKKYTVQQLKSFLTTDELKKIAKNLKLDRYSKIKQHDLIKALFDKLK